MTPSRLTGWLLALPALLFTALFLAVPLGRTLQEGGVNLGVWRDPYFLGRLGWTLAQALGTALAALLLAAPLAYLLSRYDLPGKAAFLRLLLLPFVLEPLLGAIPGVGANLGPLLPFANANAFTEIPWLQTFSMWWGPLGSAVYFGAVAAAVFATAVAVVARRDP